MHESMHKDMGEGLHLRQDLPFPQQKDKTTEERKAE